MFKITITREYNGYPVRKTEECKLLVEDERMYYVHKEGISQSYPKELYNIKICNQDKKLRTTHTQTGGKE